MLPKPKYFKPCPFCAPNLASQPYEKQQALIEKALHIEQQARQEQRSTSSPQGPLAPTDPRDALIIPNIDIDPEQHRLIQQELEKLPELPKQFAYPCCSTKFQLSCSCGKTKNKISLHAAAFWLKNAHLLNKEEDT